MTLAGMLFPGKETLNATKFVPPPVGVGLGYRMLFQAKSGFTGEVVVVYGLGAGVQSATSKRDGSRKPSAPLAMAVGVLPTRT